MRIRTSLVLFICSLGIILYFFKVPNIKERALEEGYLNLGNWSFEDSGSVVIKGEWIFNWKEFVAPSAYENNEIRDYITPHSKWIRFFSNNNKLKNHEHATYRNKLKIHGYATYHAHLTLPDTGDIMALFIPNISEAYTLYVNEKKVISSGIPGTNIESSHPSIRPRTALFIPESKDIKITIHVSNYNMARGGIKEPLVIGKAENIIHYAETKQAEIIFLISFFFMTGLYYFFVNFSGDREKTLNLSAFCLMVTSWLLVTGQIPILSIFHNIHWKVLLKIEYISMYLAMLFILNYLYSYLAYSRKSWVFLSYSILTSIFVLTVLITKPLIFTTLLIAGQIIFILYIVFAIIRFAQFTIKNHRHYLFNFLGIFFLVAAFINDILKLHTGLKTILLFPFGLTMFIFIQAIEILNRSYNKHKIIIEQRNKLLESKNRLERSRLGTIIGLAKLTEYRDEDTGLHLERIKEYCKVLATQLAKTSRYSSYITDTYINDIGLSSVLHDIGKVAVPDSILLKKGRLDSDEFAVMKEHTVIAGNILLKIESEMNDMTFLSMGKEIAFYHHEKWDGNGYPYGLKGEEIPLSARITALADVYDALTSERPYKKAFSHEKTKTIILDGKDSHFDPDIVDAFLEREEDFKHIRSTFIDKSISEGKNPDLIVETQG